jgi:hypothetical protein
MPSALLPIKNDYHIMGLRGIFRTEIKFEENHVNLTINNVEVQLAHQGLQDMRAMEMRYQLVRAIHQNQEFTMCYTTPGTKKVASTDVVVRVLPIKLGFIETPLAKAKSWVLTASVDGKEQDFLVENIRGTWNYLMHVKQEATA